MRFTKRTEAQANDMLSDNGQTYRKMRAVQMCGCSMSFVAAREDGYDYDWIYSVGCSKHNNTGWFVSGA